VVPLQQLKGRLSEAVATVTQDTLEHTWQKLNDRLDVCWARSGAHITI